MTDRPGDHAEPPSSLNLPEPPPIPPSYTWAEPPAQVPGPSGTGHGAPLPPEVPRGTGYRRAVPLHPAQQRTWAMLAHLSALGALVIGLNFLGPLLVFIGFKDRGGFVRDQAVESLNFQITTCIAGFVSILLIPFFGLGILAFLGVFIGWLVQTVMAGIAANNGEQFRYLVNLRFVH